MSKAKILTKTIAERILKEEKFEDIKGFSSIELDAAETLTNHVEWLFLDGINVLSATLADALGKHEGSLYLNGIKNLTPEAAKGLAKHKGKLVLNNLDGISSLAAQELSKFEGKSLCLGLTLLDESEGHLALASSMAKRGDVYLPELKLLSEKSALALSKIHGNDEGITLGVECLSDSPAKIVLADAIAKLPPKSWVYLDHLTSITDDFAEALGQRGGWLALRGLKNLSDKAARSLSSLKTLDISKEGKAAINKAKKTSASANKTKSIRCIPAGCPEGAFEWMRGGILAVNARRDDVERMAETLGLDHDLLPNGESAPWCLLNGIGFFHKTPKGFDNIAGFMAHHFKAMAVHLWYDDTSGLIGYTIYDAEKRKESYTTEGDFESSLPDRSKSQKLWENHGDTGFIDARFKQIGLPIPEKVNEPSGGPGAEEVTSSAKVGVSRQKKEKMVIPQNPSESSKTKPLLKQKNPAIKKGTPLQQFKSLEEIIDEHIGLINQVMTKQDYYFKHEKMRTISPLAARELASHDCFLVLGLTEISADVARELSQHKQPLDLMGISSISAEVAKELALHKGSHLYLGGLTAITESIAISLASYKGHLDLSGIKTLPDEVAKALAKHKGELDLNGVTECSENAKAFLARHKGIVNMSAMLGL